MYVVGRHDYHNHNYMYNSGTISTDASNVNMRHVHVENIEFDSWDSHIHAPINNTSTQLYMWANNYITEHHTWIVSPSHHHPQKEEGSVL